MIFVDFSVLEIPHAPALDHYYRNGAQAGWAEQYISAYCAANPWEDWAETWAHCLHIEDAVGPARACGFALMPETATGPYLDGRLSTHRPSSNPGTWIAIAWSYAQSLITQ